MNDSSRPQPLSSAQESSLPHESAALPEFEAEIELDQILYCSLSHELMDDDALDAMLASVSALNRMDHITGLLMYSEGVFVQLIEGPPQAVKHLWARLLRDQRHYGVVQLYHYRELEQRICSGWAMKRVDISTLRGIIHRAQIETSAGGKSAWAAAIERMDFLLTPSNWDSFTRNFKQAQVARPMKP